MKPLTDLLKPFATPLTTPPVWKVAEEVIDIPIQPAEATIYDDGSHRLNVPVWTYAGHYPGPVIEVWRNQAVTVRWHNHIPAEDRLPCKADEVEYGQTPGEIIPQNVLDQGQESRPTMGAGGRGFVVTHLHGAKAMPPADGWPEATLLPADENGVQTHVNLYENQQRATLLWYHDHAMHTTRLHAYAGLAGGWIIRDDEEAALNLPDGEYELPLVIQDRNLTDFHGFPDHAKKGGKPVSIRARFLHRVESGEGPLEFFGPLTLVNGRVWPRADIHAAPYRLRILNGSNARFYRLRLAERLPDGRWQWADDVPIRQIGTDNGLLNRPVELPENGLILAPAERADLIIDFSQCAGRQLIWLNTAEAPFSNSEPLPLEQLFPDDPATCMINDEAWRTPYPQVMMFNVHADKVPRLPYDFDVLENAMQNHVRSWHTEDPVARLNDKSVERLVVLVEKTESMMGRPEEAVLVQWELARKADVEAASIAPVLDARREIIIDGEPWLVVAERWQDPVTFIVRLGDTERWRFINLTADTHPMHIHLVQFRGVSRRQIQLINPACTFPDGTPADPEDVVNVVDCKAMTLQPIEIETGAEIGFDDNELGFKDTIRVNPGEMVTIAATFEGYCGRYVYHCHLLEHEDHDMMRQFVVMRDDLGPMAYQLPISIGPHQC